MQKKKILTAALASTLAATVIAGAGTFAYLQANTGTITNKFGKNAEEGLDITLTETGVTLDNEGNGEKIYEIKPNQPTISTYLPLSRSATRPLSTTIRSSIIWSTKAGQK